MADEIRRVLIYRLGSIGDMVVALPALHLVARTFPNAERRMLTNFPVNVKASAASAVLGDAGMVTGYFRYPVGLRNPVTLVKLWWSLARWRPQVLVYLGSARGEKSARRDGFFFWACGIRTQIGVPTSEQKQSNLWQDDEGAFEPECERLARNLEDLGSAEVGRPRSWDLALSVNEEARAREALKASCGRPIIAVSVGTKMQSKDWGKENWRGLLRVLGARYVGYALVLTGAAEESEASEFAADGWRSNAEAGPVLNLCGRLPPRESVACYRVASVFVGHDSGPMHLAAAAQTPCVAIFSARTLPRIWFPQGRQHRVVYHHVECVGCGLETCEAEKKRCLTSITVDEVVREVQAVLGVAGTRGHTEDRSMNLMQRT